MADNNDGHLKIIKDFCQTTNIPACGYLNKHSTFERIFWLCFLLGSLTITILLTKHFLSDWTTEAVFISLDASSHPISKVNFPGVAVCSINKISRQRAVQFANELSSYIKNINQTEMLKLVRLFGNLYDFNIYDSQNFASFQTILDNYDNLSQDKDLSDRLLALSTPCSEVVKNCSWNSRFYNCSDLFQTRLTDSGFCCVFNYARPLSGASVFSNLSTKILKTRQFVGTGIEKGLSVIISNNISDYFYTDMATRGYLIKIFAPGDFPDLSSGSLRQIIVQENSEVFIQVETNTLSSQEQIRPLPINSRKCKFVNEDVTVFGQYTSSNCFVSCKRSTILSLCNCVPFMMPIDRGSNERYINFCTLVDIPCLNKYKDKWLRYYPTDAVHINELDLEREDSLRCDCMPNCNEVTYAIDTSYFEYHSNDPVYPHNSRIHVFTNKAYTHLYKKMVTVTWYEALSTFGGTVSLFLGISIVNLVEIGVFILKLLMFYFKKYCMDMAQSDAV